MYKVCIDPGHPSYFEGTEKINWGCEGHGIKEVELVLILANMLSKALIDKGFSVIITRQDNTTVIGNKERADIAKQNNADLLLRIHANYERNGNQEFKGVRTFYPPANAKNISNASREIATAVHREIIVATNLVDRGVCDDRLCAFKNEFGMLIGSHRANEYNIPSILIEVAYLSNTEDAKRIEDTKNQEHYINAIVKGLLSYTSR